MKFLISDHTHIIPVGGANKTQNRTHPPPEGQNSLAWGHEIVSSGQNIGGPLVRWVGPCQIRVNVSQLSLREYFTVCIQLTISLKIHCKKS